MVREERLRSAPVPALSADANAQTKSEAMGADGYLVKPIKVGDLLERVRSLVSRAARRVRSEAARRVFRGFSR